MAEAEQRALWTLRASMTKDSLWMIPLVPGMKVMITENIAIKVKAVNDAQGTLKDIKYEIDASGRRIAVCAYVHVANSGISTYGLPDDIIPIVPVSTMFRYKPPEGLHFSITRRQLPLVPTYVFTDYKVQGQSMERAIIDLSYCHSLQSVYVMLSRAKSLKGIMILRSFPANKINQCLGQEFRNEFRRLDLLDKATKAKYTTCQSTFKDY